MQIRVNLPGRQVAIRVDDRAHAPGGVLKYEFPQRVQSDAITPDVDRSPRLWVAFQQPGMPPAPPRWKWREPADPSLLRGADLQCCDASSGGIYGDGREPSAHSSPCGVEDRSITQLPHTHIRLRRGAIPRGTRLRQHRRECRYPLHLNSVRTSSRCPRTRPGPSEASPVAAPPSRTAYQKHRSRPARA